MDLLPIRPVKFDRLNLVVIISMDLLPIRPGINYWSNWVEIHSFGGHNLNGFTPNSPSNLTGQIWGKSIEIDAGRFGCKSIEIDYIAC